MSSAMESIKIVNMMAGAHYMPPKANFEERIKTLFGKGQELLIVMPQKGGAQSWNSPNDDSKLAEYGITVKYLISWSEANETLSREWKKWLVGEDLQLPEVIYHHKQLTEKQFRSALFAGVTVHHPRYGRMVLQPMDHSTLVIKGKRYLLLRRVG